MTSKPIATPEKPVPSPTARPRVLLAGASGTLGRRLVPALTQSNDVAALVRPGSESRLPERDQLVEVRTAQVTQPQSLIGICDGFDAVVTTVGITRQRDGLTYDDVDYGANLNLLREAERAGVDKFLYVSVVGAGHPSPVPGIDAKHRFEQALQASSIDWVIVRPSGFFTDLLEVVTMAQRGIVYQFGDGTNRITPIDVADLASVIARLLQESSVVDEVAEQCFAAVGKQSRMVHLPRWLLRIALAVTRPFSASRYGVLSFVGHVQTGDTAGPEVGTRPFHDFLAEHVGGQNAVKSTVSTASGAPGV